MTTARADLHVHSKHSSKRSEGGLRQLQAPESYTEPLEIYRLCRERGMDFVTISDHDSIDGALEIAHLPGTFLSSEVTAEFPEDGCEIHCLVTGITEEQHREIQRLRKNIYTLRNYFNEHGVLHSIAHPLYRVNGRLTLPHLEKLLVLFNRFEALNGLHDRRANGLVRRIFSSLTPEILYGLAERHGLEPAGPAPWIKTFTGGSDDHGGFYMGTTWTRTPAAATVEEYLAHLRAGRHEPGGDTGSSARLVQSLYSTAWEHYHRQFPALLGNRKDPFAELLRALARRPEGTERLARVVSFPCTRREAPALADGTVDRDSFSRLAQGFVRSLRCAQKDADLLAAASLHFLGQLPEGDRPRKKVWFADVLPGLGGVARTLRALSSLRDGFEGGELEVFTCGGAAPAGLRARTFEPLAELPIPGQGQTLALPPILEMLDLCERERYSEIFISTPGPVGLAGLLAGKMLGIRLTGVCPSDFPLHLGRAGWLAGSPALEGFAWTWWRWFFGQMDRVYAASHRDYGRLAEHGFDVSRISLLPRQRPFEIFPPADLETLALEFAV